MVMYMFFVAISDTFLLHLLLPLSVDQLFHFSYSSLHRMFLILSLTFSFFLPFFDSLYLIPPPSEDNSGNAMSSYGYLTLHQISLYLTPNLPTLPYLALALSFSFNCLRYVLSLPLPCPCHVFLSLPLSYPFPTLTP